MNADYQDFKYKKLSDEIMKLFKDNYTEVGLLLNFGSKPEIKRMVFGNSRKNISVFICENQRPI